MTTKFKTDVRMLPLFGPPERQAADNPRRRGETGLTETPFGNSGEGSRGRNVFGRQGHYRASAGAVVGSVERGLIRMDGGPTRD